MTTASTEIANFMTASPRTIRPEATFEAARRLMRELDVRHLIVVSDDRIEGVVSERDLDAIQAECRVEPSRLTVEEAMMPLTYRVRAQARLGEVAAQMAERKIGSAVIVDDQDRPIGVFTTTDALRALAHLAG
jgi:CBS domain-containing protein